MDQFEPQNFKLDSFITVVNEFMRLDETERALWLIDNLPAYYRDYPPKEITELKNEILKRIATPDFYSKGDYDCQIDPDNKMQMDKSLRGFLVLKDVQHFNSQNIVPHIMEMAPGSFWLPLMLKKLGCKFTYNFVTLNKKSVEVVRPYIAELLSEYFSVRPVIYVACEIIEHLWHIPEIKTEMLKHVGPADVVHVSTPKYCFDTRDLDWRVNKPDVGHLRAFTPKEFIDINIGIFKEYSGIFYDSTILHAKFVHNESKYRDKINLAHEKI
jgi:hypothetical protein